MLLLAGSYGFWAYSIVPDMYVPGIAMVLLAALALEKAQVGGGRRWFVLMVLAVWGATMFHQSYALFSLVAAVVLYVHGRRGAAVVTFVGSIAMVGVSYVVAFLHQREYQDFVGFVLEYARHMQFTPYDKLQWATPIYATVGALRAWTFPEYFVRHDAVWQWVQEQWVMKLLLDERFLLRNVPPWLTLVLGGVGVGSVALLVVLFSLSLKRVHRHLRTRWAYLSLLGWAGAMAVLAFVWEASSNEFWLWLPPLMSLLLMGAGAEGRWRRYVLIAAGSGVAAATLPVVWLYQSADNDIYSVNKRYRLGLRPDDVLIAGDFQQTLALNRLYPTAAQELQYGLGRIAWRDTALQHALHRLAQPTATGRLILDPLIVMPHRSESALRQKLPGYDEGSTYRVLLRIAQFCMGLGDSEGGQMEFQSKAEGEQEVVGEREEELGLESAQQRERERRRIPLIGVVREGGGVVEFQVRSLPGMEWLR
jgi:hypothetical protein